MKPVRKYQRQVAKDLGISTNDVAMIFNDFYNTAFDIFIESNVFVLQIPYTGKIYLDNEDKENKTNVHDSHYDNEQV